MLDHATKPPQLVLVPDLIFLVGFQGMGSARVDGIEPHGSLAPLMEAVRDRLMNWRNKAAWMAIGRSYLSAIKTTEVTAAGSSAANARAAESVRTGGL
jgi:hypothetical protein